MGARISVVGLGADGWPGLAPASREVVLAAEVLLGSARQLALVPGSTTVREPWPSPLLPALPGILERHAGRRVVVLASGDPLLSGIGTTLVGLLGEDQVEVHPAVSSVALARARMGWSAESSDVVTLVGRHPDALRRWLSPRRRLVVLGSAAAEVARLLVEEGYDDSALTLLGDLGAPGESRVEGRAGTWQGGSPALAVTCVEVGRAARVLPVVPGLPDDAFEHDGQLTKRDLRALALSRLGPCPGQLLWDVGAGAGSVAIEWLRTDPRCAAVAVEADAERTERIRRNAARLGVPGLAVRLGSAPAALAGLPAPDAVFVGGGATEHGVLDACWGALRPGGRLVVHAVTLETEAVLRDRHATLGGELTRVSVEHAQPLGSFTGWRPARPVVQWAAQR
jgi:precorrin-6Y C5,15-methyltransferase (decarboxylating)